MFLRRLALARAPIQLAEAEVAVGDEGAHAEFGRECERLPVLVLCGPRVTPLHRDVSNHSMRPRLAAASAEAMSGFHSTLCKRIRLVKPRGCQGRLTGQEVCHQDAPDRSR